MNELLQYIKFLIRKRVLITVNVLIATIIAFVVAIIFTPVQFASSITFFPPYEEKGLMSFIPGMGGVGVTTSSDIVPQQISTIYTSTILRTKFIEEMDLLNKYELLGKPNDMGHALKQLDKDLSIEVEELGSLGMSTPIGYKITYFHTNPDSAHYGIQYLYKQIDSTIQSISMAHGKRKREFVREKLDVAEVKYDSIKTAFNTFKLENKAYDIPAQVDFTIKSYADLSGQMTMRELELSRLTIEYSNSHPKVIGTKRQIAVLRKKLSAIESSTFPQVLGGLESSIDLLPRYLEFTRDVEFTNKMILLLYQQLEEAILKETNELSTLEIIDPAVVPIYKARPKRVMVLAVIFIKYMFVFTVILTFYYFMKFKFSSISWLTELKDEFKK